ncbi:hypothetical protein HAX54_038987 [Datura stramonium]|uniref:RNase H type-1 domain-containing protein n=1 Tax=Datura stramonium TaxID=4076 RepID=A0ABS8SIZ5_DATST|nr:hypothetical protein [Datura stramonium]
MGRLSMYIHSSTSTKPKVAEYITNGNPGQCGGGGIIRNDSGDLRVAYARRLGIETSNFAEAMALKTGVECCMTNREIEVIQLACAN